MPDLVELQRQLNNVEDLLSLLVHLSDEKVPQLKNDINDIVKNIKGGFDKEELAKQLRTVLNQVINQSDYSKLQANIDTTTKKMIDAIESSSRKVDKWRDNYQKRSRWHFALISGAICFCFGFTSAFYWLKPSQAQQQKFLNDSLKNTDIIVEYVQNKCKNLK
jgi:ElaB/YqjD/DUF883 family membrane-anchored ribosome-binding protein